ncbi:TPA: hypothetical protein R1765_001976 [Campylobacter coli]|nr:hypothetical protein [Campylobacter coli]
MILKNVNDLFKSLLKTTSFFEISFESPDILHPNSDYATISDVAKFIESKYNLVQKFTIYIKPKLLEKMAEYIFSNKSNWEFLLQEWIKGEWRDYIVDQLHKIRTKASILEDRESFINTGAYYKTMQVKIKYDKKSFNKTLIKLKL